MTPVFYAGPLVDFCLIMLTICQENGVRSREQTRLIYFTGLSTQPNYCITNSNSFTPWRSTLISACNTGARVCYSKCMLTSSQYYSQMALITPGRNGCFVLLISVCQNGHFYIVTDNPILNIMARLKKMDTHIICIPRRVSFNISYHFFKCK